MRQERERGGALKSSEETKGARDGAGEVKKKENVSFITHQVQSVYIIHFVLFCPHRPGKCYVTSGENTHKLQTFIFYLHRTQVSKCPI